MKNNKLECIRGGASLLVFVCHLAITNTSLKSYSFLNVVTNWGAESVMLFFILSGIVINFSEKKNPKTTIGFIKNRLLRIYPLYLVGVLAAVITTKVIQLGSIPPLHLIGDLLFLGTLQGYIVSVPSTNPVIWSLAFELFFYCVYAFSIGKHQKKFILIWFVISILCIPLYYLNIKGIPGYFIAMFSFSSIWLIGYYIYEYRHLFVVNDFMIALLFASLLPAVSRLTLSPLYYDVGKYLLFAIISSPLFFYCLNDSAPEKSKGTFQFTKLHAVFLIVLMAGGMLFFSKSLIISKAVYIGLPILVLLYSYIRPDANVVGFVFLKRVFLFLGKISYSLYIIHYPILILTDHFLFKYWYVEILVNLLIVFAISTFLEFYYQPYISSFFKKQSVQVG